MTLRPPRQHVRAASETHHLHSPFVHLHHQSVSTSVQRSCRLFTNLSHSDHRATAHAHPSYHHKPSTFLQHFQHPAVTRNVLLSHHPNYLRTGAQPNPSPLIRSLSHHTYSSTTQHTLGRRCWHTSLASIRSQYFHTATIGQADLRSSTQANYASSLDNGLRQG